MNKKILELVLKSYKRNKRRSKRAEDYLRQTPYIYMTFSYKEDDKFTISSDNFIPVGKI